MKSVENRTLAEVLDELASHEFDMPRFFAEKGIKGTPEHCEKCPVAQYILRETGADEVDVSDSWTEIVFITDAGVIRHEVLHPHSVREFISDFDNRAFPELIDDQVGDN